MGEVTGPNHFFIADDDVPYKFEPGGVSHEACAGLLGVGEYLSFLAGEPAGTAPTRATVDRAFDIMHACETPPTRR